MSDMRKLINLIESVQTEQLSEAPINSFRKQMGQGEFNNIGDAEMGFTMFGAALGALMPWFAIDMPFMSKIILSMFSGAVGTVIASLMGGDLTNTYIDKKLEYAKSLSKEDIDPAIIQDLKIFARDMVNNIPDSIIKNALEISNIDALDNTNVEDMDFRAMWDTIEGTSELEVRTEKLINLLNAYIIKYNDKFDNLANKYNLTPVQLGAIQYVTLGSTVENAFVQQLQSKLTNPSN